MSAVATARRDGAPGAARRKVELQKSARVGQAAAGQQARPSAALRSLRYATPRGGSRTDLCSIFSRQSCRPTACDITCGSGRVGKTNRVGVLLPAAARCCPARSARTLCETARQARKARKACRARRLDAGQERETP